MSKFKAWMYAFRLRTLPLSLSSIVTGSAMGYAYAKSNFSWPVFGLAVLTTVFLQVLSNLANDYGDSEKGTDNHERIGPMRAVQSGLLSFAEIKRGIAVSVALCLLSGIALLYFAFGSRQFIYALLFFGIGLAAIAAAIKYTVGKGAYGYRGLGDVFVMLFFGFVGVGGSYYLQAHQLPWTVLLPAFTIGAFSTGVLNLNNMRDVAGDANAGKITLVVKMGLNRAKKYQNGLIIGGFAAALVYVAISFTSTMQFAFVLTLPLFRRHLVAVNAIEDPKDFDPLLKQLAISTFIFSLLFGLGMVVGSWNG